MELLDVRWWPKDLRDWGDLELAVELGDVHWLAAWGSERLGKFGAGGGAW